MNQNEIAYEIIKNDDAILDTISKFLEKNNLTEKNSVYFVRNAVYVGVKLVIAGYPLEHIKTLFTGFFNGFCERSTAIQFARIIYGMTITHREEYGF